MSTYACVCIMCSNHYTYVNWNLESRKSRQIVPSSFYSSAISFFCSGHRLQNWLLVSSINYLTATTTNNWFVFFLVEMHPPYEKCTVSMFNSESYGCITTFGIPIDTFTMHCTLCLKASMSHYNKEDWKRSNSNDSKARNHRLCGSTATRCTFILPEERLD